MASEYARRMITEWGMSDRLGFQAYGEQQQEVFLGQALTQRKQISERTAQLIDEEVQLVLDTCYKAATKLLTQKKAKLELLGKTLLEHETLTGDEIKVLLEEGKAPDVLVAETSKSKKRSSVPEVNLDV
jgi:cell division protease FtsH